MSILNKESNTLKRKIITAMFMTALATLPFINRIPISTYLLIGLGTVLLFTGNISHDWSNKHIFPWLFTIFYILQIIGFISSPHNRETLFALEQKASLLFIPILISSLYKYDETICKKGIKAFIIGNILASIYCFFFAFYRYYHTPDTQFFFYHPLVYPLYSNAIYSSLYVLVSILYLLHFYTEDKWKIPSWFFVFSLMVLIVTLFMLSSKMIIVCGSALILLFILHTTSKSLKTLITASLVTGIVLMTFTTNSIKHRFQEWNFAKCQQVLSLNDFTNYPFDDFDLRILLARLGYEVTQENNSWILGNGGIAYHTPLNQKMLSYHLFSGNEVTKDTGYINYNMHNQYFECFMQYGLLGFSLLFTIFIYIIISAFKVKSKVVMSVSALFFFSFLSESVLETQAGILLFTIIIYYGWKSTKQLTLPLKMR